MKLFKKILLLSLSPTFFLLHNSSITKAGIIRGYKPPTTGTFLQVTESSGTRGRCPVQAPRINLLAPNDHIGITTSSRIPFLYYTSYQNKMPLSNKILGRFVLIEVGTPTVLVDQQVKFNKDRINKFDLPKEIELLPGKQYRWTVSFVCNESSPSANPYAQAVMERIEPPLQFKQKLERSSEGQKASLYEENGIWYDALSSRLKIWEDQPNEQANSESFLKLLTQVGLSKKLAEEILLKKYVETQTK